MIAFTGEAAEVRWGYHSAARLGRWSCERNRTGGTFTAQILSADEFKLSQEPLVLVVPATPSPWRWPLSDLQISGSTLSGRVG